MLSIEGIIARYILAFCLFFAAATGMLTGSYATAVSILACIELGTALIAYSPLYEAYEIIKFKLATRTGIDNEDI